MKISDFKIKNSQKIFELREHEIEQNDRVPLLHFDKLDDTGIVKHCFTTRGGGVSKDIFSSMNLSFNRGDEKSAVETNYQRLAMALDTTVDRFVTTDQTHTTNVIRVGNEEAGIGVVRPRPYTDVDGLVTNEKNVVLSTFFADCVPLFFVDTKNHAIGLSLSGWKGTVNRMGQKTLEVMKREFGTNPADVVAAIGPSICQDCYEISEDVAEKFKEQFPSHVNEILIDKKNGHYQLDLWRTNQIIMIEAGILEKNIAVTNICTCCNDSLLFSHRASHGKRGNLGAFMYLVD